MLIPQRWGKGFSMLLNGVSKLQRDNNSMLSQYGLNFSLSKETWNKSLSKETI